MKENQSTPKTIIFSAEKNYAFFNKTARSIKIGAKTKVILQGLQIFKPANQEELDVCLEFAAKHPNTLNNITGEAVIIQGQGFYEVEISRLKEENTILTAEVESLKKQLNEVSNHNIELINKAAVEKATTKKDSSNS